MQTRRSADRVQCQRKPGFPNFCADPVCQVFTIDENQISVDEFASEILDLDSALERLEQEHPRPAKVVECRFFGGLDVDQTAELLKVAPRTVDRDWALARAWLNRELGRRERASELS